MNKTGQVFTLDFFIGLFAFIALLVLGFTQLFSFLPNQAYEQLHEDALYISSVLVEPGYPLTWNVTSVLLPGLADNQRLNITKLSAFHELSYPYSKILLHTTVDYAVMFRNTTQYLNITDCVYGYPIDYTASDCTPDFTSISYKHLIKIQRLVAYNGTIITLELYVWKR